MSLARNDASSDVVRTGIIDVFGAIIRRRQGRLGKILEYAALRQGLDEV